MSKRIFWYGLMTGAVLLWAGSIALGVYLSSKGNSYAWLLFGIILLVHTAENKVSFPLGKRLELSPGLVMVKTLIFGFTWWLPLRRGIIER